MRRVDRGREREARMAKPFTYRIPCERENTAQSDATELVLAEVPKLAVSAEFFTVRVYNSTLEAHFDDIRKAERKLAAGNRLAESSDALADACSGLRAMGSSVRLRMRPSVSGIDKSTVRAMVTMQRQLEGHARLAIGSQREPIEVGGRIQ